VPEDAKKNKDLAFLEGCWQSETGLYNNDGVPIMAEYCFDKKGRGTRFVREKGGRNCSGPATARFQGDTLSLDASEAHCRGGGGYVKQKVDCTGSGSGTHCQGKELGGSRNKWDADFRRK
jgi:hypothetical protein